MKSNEKCWSLYSALSFWNISTLVCTKDYGKKCIGPSFRRPSVSEWRFFSPWCLVNMYLHFANGVLYILYSFTHLFIHSFTYLFSHLGVHSSNHSFILFFCAQVTIPEGWNIKLSKFIQSYIHLLIHSFIGPLIHSSIHLSIHLFIHLLNTPHYDTVQ